MFRDYTKYEVYPDGRIWSYSHKKFLKPKTEKNGYQRVCLVDNSGKIKHYYIHRVIFEAVSGKPIPLGMQINHRNENKTDNRFFENLELVTPSENVNYGSGNKRRAKALTNNTKTSKQVGAFKDDKLVMTFPSTKEASRIGFNQSSVSSCCNGKQKTHKGYTWKYI